MSGFMQLSHILQRDTIKKYNFYRAKLFAASNSVYLHVIRVVCKCDAIEVLQCFCNGLSENQTSSCVCVIWKNVRHEFLSKIKYILWFTICVVNFQFYDWTGSLRPANTMERIPLIDVYKKYTGFGSFWILFDFQWLYYSVHHFFFSSKFLLLLNFKFSFTNIMCLLNIINIRYWMD